MFIRVDNGGGVILRNSRRIKIVKMYMAMYKVPGFEKTHKREKNPETAMTGIVPVVNTSRRSVGKQNIKPSSSEQPVDDKSG
jgi:hypothetical protein